MFISGTNPSATQQTQVTAHRSTCIPVKESHITPTDSLTTGGDCRHRQDEIEKETTNYVGISALSNCWGMVVRSPTHRQWLESNEWLIDWEIDSENRLQWGYCILVCSLPTAANHQYSVQDSPLNSLNDCRSIRYRRHRRHQRPPEYKNHSLQEAQLSQREWTAAYFNFGKNISANSVHLTLLYVRALTSTNHHFTVLRHHVCT